MFCNVSNSRRSLLTAILGLGLIWGGTSSGVAATNVPPTVRVSTLLRLTVENRDGQQLGRIRDVVLNLNQGTVHSVLVGPEGFFATRKAVHVVPPHLLLLATAKRGVAGLNVSWRTWSGAPTLNPDDLDTLGDPALSERIRRHYAADQNLATAENKPAAELLTETGRQSAESAATRVQTALASSLTGSSVFGEDREKLGEVVDVLVTMEDRSPAFLLVARGRAGDGKHGYAVPVKKLNLEAGRKLTFSDLPKELGSAPVFDPSASISRDPEKLHVFRYALDP